MQHIVIRSSKKRKLTAGADWRLNGVDRYYSHRYGYGLLDAGLLVTEAANWNPLPEQRNCSTTVIE